MTLAQGITTVAPPTTRFTASATLLGDLLSRVLMFAIAATGFYFLFRTITTGFLYLTSAGDPAKLQAAQKTFSHSLIGLITVLSAFFIAQIAETLLGINIL